MVKKLLMFALLLLAVGMAVPKTRAEIQVRAIAPVMDAIGNRLAPGRLDAMADQIDVRLGRGESLPSGNFEAWLRRDYTGPQTDPWENPWFIRSGRRDYTVGSMGPDGEMGTDDDIVVTRPLSGGRR